MSLRDGVIDGDLQTYYRSLLEEAGDGEVFVTQSGSYSGVQALGLCERIRDELIRRGFKPNEYCAYGGSDDIGMVAAAFGIALAGGASFGLQNYVGADSWTRFIRDTGARFVVCESFIVEKLRDHLLEAGCEVEFIEITAQGSLLAPTGSETFEDRHVSYDDASVVRFTAGRAGAAQGIVLSHRAEFYSLAKMAAVYGQRERGRYLQLTPTTDLQGIGMLIAALFRRETVIIYWGKPTTEGIVRAMEQHRITDLFLPSSQMVKLARSDAAAMADLSALDRFVYGGQKVSAEDIMDAYDLLDCDFAQVYGSTETGLLMWLSPEDHRKGDAKVFDSAGVKVPFAGTEVVVQDPRTGEEMPLGEVGHVVTKNPSVCVQTLGYDAPVEVVDGWRDTLDQGYFDEEGYLHIVGVSRDVILYRGFVMYAFDVEKVLLDMDGVRAAVAHPISDAADGEHIFAWVTLDEGVQYTEEQLGSELEVVRGPWYRPSRIQIVDEIPDRDASGAYDKQKLRERAEAIMAQ